MVPYIASLLLAAFLCMAGGEEIIAWRNVTAQTSPVTFVGARTARQGAPATIAVVLSGNDALVQSAEAAQPRTGNVSPRIGQTIEHILSNPSLWGTDFLPALASLPAFQRAGEHRIVVFPDRIVGETTYKTATNAEQTARTLDQALRVTRPSFNARFQTLQRSVISPAVKPPRVEVIRFPEDNTTRVAAIPQTAQLLPPDLAITTVRQQLGEPEKVTQILLDAGTERRPVILTLHHYAGDAITFATSDLTPKPGVVDRVFLTVPAVTATIF